MRFSALAAVLFASTAIADTTLKNAGTTLGPILSLDARTDGGISARRTTGGVGYLYCSSASATETGCVNNTTQSFSGNKTFTGVVKAPVFDGGAATIGQLDIRGATLTNVGNASTFTIKSNTADGATSDTAPAMLFQLGESITAENLAFAFRDSASNNLLRITAGGTLNFVAHATDPGLLGGLNGASFTSALGAGGTADGFGQGGVGGAYSFTAGAGGTSDGVSVAGAGGAASLVSGAGGTALGTQVGGAGGAMSLAAGHGGRGGIGGAVAIWSGDGGNGTADYAAAAGGAVSVTAGTGGAQATAAAGATGGSLTLLSGPGGSGTTGGTGGAILLRSGGGGGNGLGAASSAGGVVLDTGAATQSSLGAWGSASLTIGATNARTLTIGNTSSTATHDGAAVYSATVSYTPSAVVGTDTGDGSAQAITLSPGGTAVTIDCQDAHGCNVTMSEGSIRDGQHVCITNISANTCVYADSAGVSEMVGTFNQGQWDTVCLMYITDRWVELSRSNN